MKTKIFSLFLSAIACIGLASCHDDNWTAGETAANEGTVSLSSMKVDVDEAETVFSRAGVSTDNFIIDLVDKSTGAVKRSYTYASMPEVVSLAVGDYTVNVKSHKVKDAEWEAPYYVGSADFSIEVGKITEIGTVKCKFSNIKVTVKFTKELASYMGSDAKVRVIANDHGELDYTATETRAGYFAAIEGSSTLVAEFTATIKGNPVQAIKTFTDVNAGQHHIITFSVKNGTASLPDEYGTIEASGLRIDADIEHENVGGNAPAGDENQESATQRPGNEEWPDDPTPDPGPEQPGTDPVQSDAITIEPDQEKCKDLDLNGGYNAVVDGAAYIVNIHAESGIQILNVKIESDNENFISSAGEFVPLDFDMAHLNDKEYEDLASIGLEGNDAVLNKQDVPFDISGLVPLLAAFEGVHTFTISVTDNDGNTLTKKLIFKV